MNPIHSQSEWLDSHTLNFRISEPMLKSLRAIGRIKACHAGETVVSYGSKIDYVAICLSGQFRVLLNSIDGHSQLVRFLTEREMYGVPSALANAPFPTDVVCDKPGDLLIISQSSLESRLRSDPDFALALIKNLATRVAELFGFMEADLLPSLRARVYQALLRLSKYHGTPSATSQETVLHFSQSELASSTNASRQKVHVELKRMEKEGMIALGYRTITLKPAFFKGHNF
ncbi:MAG: cAMP-activated global transcriptional regulator [Pseudomonadota bacterium]|jgi:CRP-like cAMP-binding protein